MKRILIGCEFSGIVRESFRSKGWDAWSCDLLPTEIMGKHLQCDVLEAAHSQYWDMAIFHPPCTYLCAGGVNWINRKPEWRPGRDAAVVFVKKLLDAPISRIALENPIGHLSTAIRKPDQIFRVWQFGEPFKKDVCLWLKNLPPLIPTHREKPEKLRTFDFWSSNRKTSTGGSKKSITFKSVANAMADQWNL